MSDTKPIIMSGPMVRAILDGRKTQTRRVLKPQPTGTVIRAPGGQYADDLNGRCFDAPYAPGQLLWVRETWCDLRGGGFGVMAAYRADSLGTHGDEDSDAQRAREEYGYRWRPSIHMPRWASRLTLEVTDVRVQRAQEISQEDARAEGAGDELHPDSPHGWRESFAALWDSLNAKRGYGWDQNPWVVAITFKAHRANVDDLLREAA